MSVGRVAREKWVMGACVLALSGMGVRFAGAGEIWTGGGGLTDNKWTTAANWSPSGAPANDGSANIVMVGPDHISPNVDLAWSINSLAFPSGAAAAFTIGGSALAIGGGGISNASGFGQTIGNPIVLSASQIWNTGGPILSTGGVSGDFGITKNGAGFLVFQGIAPNTYTGTTTINSGLLLLNNSTPNAAIAGSLTVGDGVGLDSVRLLQDEQITQSAGTVVSINSSGQLNLNNFSETISDLNMTGGSVLAGSGTLTVMGSIMSNAHSGPATIADRLSFAAGTRMVDVADGAAANDLVISAAISSGGLIKSGAGTLMIGGGVANSYMGTTSVLEGTVVLGKTVADGAIRGDLIIHEGGQVVLGGDEQISAVGNRVLVEAGGVLNLGGFREAIGDLEMAGGTIAGGTLLVQGEVTALASAAPATIGSGVDLGASARIFNIADGAAVNDMEVSGAIRNGGVVKTGPGVLLLSGSAANGPMASMTVNQGTLLLNKTTADGAVGGNLTIGDGVGGASSDVVMLGAGEQIAAGLGNVVSVNSSGLLDLAGNVETIMGLTMTGGTIASGTGGRLKVMGDVNVNASGLWTSSIWGTLDLGDGVRVFKVADGPALIELNLAASVSGGGITKMGPGRLRLMGETYSQGLRVMEGTVTLATDASAGTGTLTLSGGVIEGEGAGRTLGNAVVINGAAAVNGTSNITLTGAISSSGVLSKRGTGTLTISGPQTSAAGAGITVVGGRLNLNSDSGAAATAGAAAMALMTLRVGGNGDALAVLGADQELRAVEVNTLEAGMQVLDLNSPAGAGGYRAMRVYPADIVIAENAINAAIRSGSSGGEGIIDSGLAAHVGAKIGVALVNDAHGDAHLLIRPTRAGDLNLDGTVTIADFLALAGNFNVTGTATWDNGDLNRDASVTIADFLELAGNFGMAYDGGAVVGVGELEQVAQFASVHGVAVPEAGMAGILVGAMGLMVRRRRGK
jgi:autotransporter-associated beta strand protein